MINVKKYILLGTLILSGLACVSCGKKEGGETAASAVEVEETGETEVEDPEAYSKVEEAMETEGTQEVNPSGIVAEYDYVSAYAMPRQEEDGKIRSYLSGKLVDKEAGTRRPVAVMLNNIEDALPMSGVSYADVIYECVVEGGLTRMMGIFENYDDLDKIGSVRSCRNYFVYCALEFDSIYCHYGQSVYAMPLLEEDFVDNLSGLGAEGDTVYYRTNDRIAPHNAYASAKGIAKGIENLGYRTAYRDNYTGKFTFAKDGDVIVPSAPETYDATHIEPGYVINKPWFDYNPEDGRYYRFEYGDKQIDAENDQQLYADNVVLQYTTWSTVDDKGYLAFDCHSGGDMVYISKGKAVPGTWIRFDGDQGATRYFDREGKEIVFNQGKTWICLIQDTMGDKVVIK